MKQRSVTIAGKRYEVRYSLEDAMDMEAEAGAGRTIANMVSNGTMKERAILIWGGLKHADEKLTPRQVVKMLDAHCGTGGEWDRDVYLPCVRALMENRLLGAYNEREIDDLMSKLGGADEGKAQASTA